MNVRITMFLGIAILCLGKCEIALAQAIPQDTIITGAMTTGTKTYRAVNRITASNDISGGNVTFLAGGVIKLMPGFRAKGTTFKAIIGTPGARMGDIPLNVENKPETSLVVYPNPFKDETTIEFYVGEGIGEDLVIYNLSEKEVKRISEKVKSSNKQKVVFDASSLPSGLYICEFNAGGKKLYKKIIKL